MFPSFTWTHFSSAASSTRGTRQPSVFIPSTSTLLYLASSLPVNRPFRIIPLPPLISQRTSTSNYPQLESFYSFSSITGPFLFNFALDYFMRLGNVRNTEAPVVQIDKNKRSVHALTFKIMKYIYSANNLQQTFTQATVSKQVTSNTCAAHHTAVVKLFSMVSVSDYTQMLIFRFEVCFSVVHSETALFAFINDCSNHAPPHSLSRI